MGRVETISGPDVCPQSEARAMIGSWEEGPGGSVCARMIVRRREGQNAGQIASLSEKSRG